MTCSLVVTPLPATWIDRRDRLVELRQPRIDVVDGVRDDARQFDARDGGVETLYHIREGTTRSRSPAKLVATRRTGHW